MPKYDKATRELVEGAIAPRPESFTHMVVQDFVPSEETGPHALACLLRIEVLLERIADNTERRPPGRPKES